MGAAQEGLRPGGQPEGSHLGPARPSLSELSLLLCMSGSDGPSDSPADCPTSTVHLKTQGGVLLLVQRLLRLLESGCCCGASSVSFESVLVFEGLVH